MFEHAIRDMCLTRLLSPLCFMCGREKRALRVVLQPTDQPTVMVVCPANPLTPINGVPCRRVDYTRPPTTSSRWVVTVVVVVIVTSSILYLSGVITPVDHPARKMMIPHTLTSYSKRYVCRIRLSELNTHSILSFCLYLPSPLLPLILSRFGWSLCPIDCPPMPYDRRRTFDSLGGRVGVRLHYSALAADDEEVKDRREGSCEYYTTDVSLLEVAAAAVYTHAHSHYHRPSPR